MAMTLAERMLADRAGLREVEPGQLVEVPLDLVMGNDITAPIAIEAFEAAGAKRVFDPERIALVASHFVPARDISSADQTSIMRRFARKHSIRHYYPEGQGGIEHTLLPERGIVVPGDIVIGADSHTCTYGGIAAFATGVGSTDLAYAMATGRTWFKVPESMRVRYTGRRRRFVTGKDLILHTIRLIGDDGALYRAIEFTGDAIRDLPVEDRLTMSNMTIEAGGKVGIAAFDETTERYEQGRAMRPWRVYQADSGARYVEEIEVDVAALPDATDQRGGGCRGRPGLHRLLHQRAPQRPARGRRHSEGAAGPPGDAPDRHPGDAGRLHGRAARGPDRGLRRGGRRRRGLHLRPLPRRAHGRAGQGRALPFDLEPQLCRPHGRPRGGGLPGGPGRGRGDRRARPHHPSRGDGGKGGRVMARAFSYGDNVGTDVIIPGRYLVTGDPKVLGLHCLENLDPGFIEAVRPGDVVVGRRNFGCGSSREHAPLAIKGAGVSMVIAASFARIFFRNAINIGLPVYESPEAAQGIESGDEVSVEPERGVIRNLSRGEEYPVRPLPPFVQEIVAAGGLMARLRLELAGGEGREGN